MRQGLAQLDRTSTSDLLQLDLVLVDADGGQRPTRGEECVKAVAGFNVQHHGLPSWMLALDLVHDISGTCGNNWDHGDSPDPLSSTECMVLCWTTVDSCKPARQAECMAT